MTLSVQVARSLDQEGGGRWRVEFEKCRDVLITRPQAESLTSKQITNIHHY